MHPVKLPLFLVLFLCLIPVPDPAAAQDFSGIWTGTLKQESGGLSSEYAYAIRVVQQGGMLSGDAYIEFNGRGGKLAGSFEITLTILANGFHYKDLAITNSTLPQGQVWCIKEGHLRYDPQRDRLFGELRGVTNEGMYSTPCARSYVDLYRTQRQHQQPDGGDEADERGGRDADDGSRRDEWAGNGSCVVIDPKGILATNHHVVEGATAIEVDFGEGDDLQSLPCEVILTDRKNDLAILRVRDKRFRGFGPLPYSLKASTVRTAEQVFALGYPKALDILGTELKYTRGDVSALSGAQGDPTTYTLSLSIQPGNSGGPLFDFNGNLIGIINAKIVSEDVDNVSYAIKALYLKNLVESGKFRVTLPKGTGLAGKPAAEQIEALRGFVGLVKVR